MQGWSKVNIQWSQLNTQGWEWENTYLQWNAYIDVIIHQNVASLMKMRLSKKEHVALVPTISTMYKV